MKKLFLFLPLTLLSEIVLAETYIDISHDYYTNAGYDSFVRYNEEGISEIRGTVYRDISTVGHSGETLNIEVDIPNEATVMTQFSFSMRVEDGAQLRPGFYQANVPFGDYLPEGAPSLGIDASPQFAGCNSGATFAIYEIKLNEARDTLEKLAMTYSVECEQASLHGDIRINSDAGQSPMVIQASSLSEAYPGQTVVLHGYGSHSADGILSYAWEQLSGSEIQLSDFTAQNPEFVAPEAPGPLKFKLTVTNGLGESLSKNLIVNIKTSAEVRSYIRIYNEQADRLFNRSTNMKVGCTRYERKDDLLLMYEDCNKKDVLNLNYFSDEDEHSFPIYMILFERAGSILEGVERTVEFTDAEGFCNGYGTVTYKIHKLSMTDTKVNELAIDMDQHCEVPEVFFPHKNAKIEVRYNTKYPSTQTDRPDTSSGVNGTSEGGGGGVIGDKELAVLLLASGAFFKRRRLKTA